MIRRFNKQGQNMVEYILLFAIVIIVLLLALAKKGFVTQAINQSLDLSVTGIELMANSTYVNGYNGP